MNYQSNASGRIILVWDPRVTVFIYHESAQSVTCGVVIPADNLSITVFFVYAFNDLDDRSPLWDSLVDIQATTHVSRSPWAIVGDFNQILRVSHHSNHISGRVDTSGIEEINLSPQDAELFEAQVKGLPFTWTNNQDDNPISTRIDHAFINQHWSSSFLDSYAEFLEPIQFDHAPCLFHLPSYRRWVCKPFKFFPHVIYHPEYSQLVSSAWNCNLITGTDQFKLVRSLKMLKVVLRRLNKRNFSGISQRFKDQKFIVDGLQRSLLTLPDSATAREEHIQRQKLNVLLTAEEKYYRQRSRVRWADVGDRNTVFYHRVVTQHVTVNHIHFLKDEDGRVICTTEELKSHSAQYFQSILGVTDLPNSLAPMEELQDLLPFRCSELQQAYLSRTVLEPEIKGTIFSMPTNKSPGPDGYSIKFIRASWDVVGPDIINAVSEFFRNGRLLKDLNTTAITLIPKKPEACTLGDYRPISCCNIVYKVISKIIANRLKPILRVSVSPNQAAFLKGCSLG